MFSTICSLASFFQFHHDAHTLTAGLILDVVNALDALILCQVGDGLHQACLVHHVRDLRNDNGLTSTHLFKVGLSTEGDPASAGAVGGTDAALAHDNAAGGEVRSLDTGHQLIHGAVRIFHQHMDAVDDFAQIMRRNIGRHADSDTHRAVDQDIGKTARQHCRFFQTVVIVGDERHGLLVDIRQHLQGDLGHSRLCITVSSRRVAVYRTEVTLTVHQHIPHGEILRQTHQRIIDRSVTVGGDSYPAQHRRYRRTYGMPYRVSAPFRTWYREYGGVPVSDRHARPAMHGQQ